MKYYIIKLIVLSFWLRETQCTIDGLSYMDPIIQRNKDNQPRKPFDPCNPLYWYPSQIPEYCYYKPTELPPMLPPVPLPLPVPVPVPQPAPPLSPWPIPIPSPIVPPEISPYPMLVPAPLNPMISVPGPLPQAMPLFYAGYQSQRTGMVPGLPGIVTQDGGINIMPFSDVYADLLEKHANKLTRRKIQKLLERYREYPKSKYARQLVKYSRQLRGV